MDGENNGKTLLKWMILGVPLFLETPKSKESMLDCVLFARDKWLRPGVCFFCFAVTVSFLGPQILTHHFGGSCLQVKCVP